MPGFIHQPVDEDVLSCPDGSERAETEAERMLWLRDRLESVVVARDTEFAPTVYVDPTVIETDRAWDLVKQFYEETYPGRTCSYRLCDRDELPMGNIVRYPEAEALFLARGYVSDMDVRSFGRGASHSVTAYRRRNEDICFHQLRAIGALLRSGLAGLGGVCDLDRQLAELMGTHRGRPVPLVADRGMFLPRRGHWVGGKIHLAYSAGIGELLVADRGNPIEICGVSPLERDDQIAFEVGNSTRFFGGAAPAAVALWQAQALAILRKATEEIAFLTGRRLNREETDVATSNQQVLRSLLNPKRGGHPVDLEFHEPDYPSLRGAAVDEYLAKLQESFEGRRMPTFSGIDQGVAPVLAFVAALNGSTYAPQLDFEDSIDLQDVSLTLQPVGRWVWSLKNRRHATLDRFMARKLLEVLGVLADDETERNLAGFGEVLAGRFAEAVWKVLVPVCRDLVDDERAEPIAVTYEWTRDVDHPWSASRSGDELLIRGPLLDFPLHAAATWNERAAVIEEEGGFTLHRAR